MTLKTVAAAVVSAALFLPVKAEALETNELLALVAMPLAVAAVSEVTDVPMSDLMDVVTLLNDANVPPVQFVEVVRYAPVALVVEEEPTRTPFVEFVRTRFDAGVVGVPLVTEIEREIRFYGVPDAELDVIAPSLVIADNDDFIPAPVRTRLAAQRSGHPHGGPPGQLKKERGLQTGAEVVHEARRAARVDGDFDDRRVAKKARRGKAPKAAKIDRVERADRVERVDRGGRVAKAPKADRGGRGHGNNDGNGKGNSGGGNGKGKGKGKG
jgi:hypothetical protein